MKLKVLIILVVVNFCSAAGAEEDFCVADFKNKTSVHPFDCCQYPSLNEAKVEGLKDCQEKCDPKDFCCPSDCFTRLSGIYVNRKINADKVLELMLNDSTEPEKWRATIQKSIEKCQNSSEFKLFIKILTLLIFN